MGNVYHTKEEMIDCVKMCIRDRVEAGKTATLKVSDTPKVTDTLIELFKIDMETQKDNPQGNASLAGAEFTWKYYAGFYNNKDNIPAEATRTWVTKTIAEKEIGRAHV